MSDADKLFNEAAGRGAAGEYAEAVKLYREALEMEQGHIDAWDGLANALYALGKYEEARDAARELLTYRPKFPDAWFLIGQAEAQMGHYSEAAASLEIALHQKEALKPRFKEFWNALAGDHAFRKDEKARELAEQYAAD